ncbi:glycosyltransferase family 25 protein [Rhodobacteraceae bacterium RKSG542]|uniref:glycosyltransferase family 25 protein n=1 Tax=Pseudovibrio flavus TaxID=2529854 RepID=UPI0012BCB8EA|nr:glycosyltransferase family 25 protein [Pseudovibrio flavus]MTI16488.1 glycosyltransferase family 25 protein [Pseudovibrio flavus]
MKIVVINLKEDKDRLAHMHQELQTLGLPYEVQHAFRGKAIPQDLQRYFLNERGDIDSAMTEAEIGCYASHLAVMADLLKSEDEDMVLVMEDDLALSPLLPEFVRSVEGLPENWEIIRLSNPSKSTYTPVANLPNIGEVVQYWRVPNNAGAYLVSKKGAQKFLEYRALRKRPIDEDLRRPWEHDIQTYGILPPLATANILASSIDRISGERSLPARKRFKDAGHKRVAELSFRVHTFGVLGSADHFLRSLLSGKKRRTRTVG